MTYPISIPALARVFIFHFNPQDQGTNKQFKPMKTSASLRNILHAPKRRTRHSISCSHLVQVGRQFIPSLSKKSQRSIASMRVGPALANAASSASLRPCTVSTSTAGTPNPSARSVHRMGGSLRSVRRRVAAPGAPTRCMASSSLRMAYTRLEHTTVTTSRRSRACVRDVRLGWRFKQFFFFFWRLPLFKRKEVLA